MSRARVGFFIDGEFRELVSGSEEWCRGWVEGYNLHADVCVTLLAGDDPCQCGPQRRPYTPDGDSGYHPRTGCLRCDRWDSPLRLKGTP